MARGDSQAHGNEGVQGEGSREGPEKLNWAWGGGVGQGKGCEGEMKEKWF